VGLEERLLNDVRGIELSLEARVQLEPCQEVQILAIFLQRRVLSFGFAGHPSYLRVKT
jgi:hypothetical protein